MNCGETEELVQLYVDRELDLVKSLELERHLSDCDSCSKSHASLKALQSAVGAIYQQPSAHLKKRVVSALRKERKREAGSKALPWRWIGVVASFALLLILSWGIFRLLSGPGPDEALAREVVSSHVRSLMANHLADVQSSDQHTVKPWFNGRLDFSPPVIDLADQGYALAGGRLDYLDGRAVAALVYQRRMHFINLFIWPSKVESDRPEPAASLNGYNVIHWYQSGISCWAVSDLNANELNEFVRLLESKSSS
jgi:anti-sigma factor RsiW